MPPAVYRDMQWLMSDMYERIMNAGFATNTMLTMVPPQVGMRLRMKNKIKKAKKRERKRRKKEKIKTKK